MPANLITVGATATSADNVTTNARGGRQNDTIVSELHGKYYEQTFRSNVFSGGMTLTSISNATFTTGTLGATETPIIGLFNPSTSTVNAVVLYATLGITTTAATTTGGGPFVWATSVGNTAISTGNTPLNRKSLTAVGSQCKDMSGVALTGLTTNMAVRFGSALNGGSAANFSFVGTAVGQFTPAGGVNIEFFDGSLIVPPGGVIGLLATTTPVAQSAVAGIVWEEIPV